MNQVSNAVSTTSYTTALGGSAYWLLNSYTPDQWTAIGVMGTLVFAGITCAANIIFKIWDRKHNMVRKDED